MSRRPRKPPTYSLHKASGRAVVRIDGRDHYLGAHGSQESIDRYNGLIAEWITGQRSGDDLAVEPDPNLTINELLAAYLKFANRYYVKDGEPTKEVSNLQYALKPLAAIYGMSEIKDFGPLRLKTVREALVQSGLSRKVVNNRIKRIKRVFRWGVENQLVSAGVLHALEAVAPLKRGRCEAKETKPVQPVAEADVRAVIKVAPLTVATMIEVQWLTGMRPGEVVIMRPDDVDQSGRVWVYRPQRHKTQHFGIEREIIIGPQAQALLQRLPARTPLLYYFSPRAAMKERYAARSTHRSKPNTRRKTARKLQDRYTTQTYGRAVAYLCKKHGIPHWSPNQLRHAAATRLRQEFGLDAAQAVLGHKTAHITQVYASLDRQKAAEVIGKVG